MTVLDRDPDHWDPGWLLPVARFMAKAVAWAVALAVALVVLAVVAGGVMNALSPTRDTTSLGVGVVFAVLAVGAVALLVKSRGRRP